MRVSPVAHWFEDKDEMLAAAADTAAPTHNHEEGIKGAQTVALAIFKAMEYNRGRYQEAPLHIDEIISECVRFSGYDINMPKSSVLNKFDETCQGTVHVALKIISMSQSFEDAVRMAVSLGADADTLGAIVGSIAEAIWGIPMDLRDKVESYLPEEMNDVLEEFYHERRRSFKPLIDTTFADMAFDEAAWDMLDSDEKKKIQDVVLAGKVDKRRLMAERVKARQDWYSFKDVPINTTDMLGAIVGDLAAWTYENDKERFYSSLTTKEALLSPFGKTAYETAVWSLDRKEDERIHLCPEKHWGFLSYDCLLIINKSHKISPFRLFYKGKGPAELKLLRFMGENCTFPLPETYRLSGSSAR